MKVVWGYWTPDSVWSGVTYPGGWSIGHCPNYYCKFIEDAGAVMLKANNSAKLNDAQFIQLAKEADYFFYSADNWENGQVSLGRERGENRTSILVAQRGAGEARGAKLWSGLVSSDLVCTHL